MLFNVPKLQTLACVIGLEKLRLLRPQTVRHLRIGLNEGVNLATYEAVEDFRVDRPSSIDRQIVRQLPKLAEFHLEEDESQGLDYAETADIMNRDLKVYFLEHLLDEHRRFEDYQFSSLYVGVFCS